MKVVLLGHGHCATGYLSSLEMIVGKQEHVEAIDFLDSMTPQVLEEKLEVAIQCEKEVLVLCDLLGGTPFKMAAAYALRSKDQRIEVVSGMNLAMVLEVALGVDNLSDESIARVVASAKSGIITSKELFELSDNEAKDDGDGI